MLFRKISFLLLVLSICIPQGLIQSQDLSGISIAIDAGHGMNSVNEGPSGLKEYDINMRVARFLEDYLYSVNIDTVIMTQLENRPEPGLSAREDLANSNGVDWFHSIHHNAFDGQTRYTVDIFQEIIGQNKAKWTEAVEMSGLISEELFKALRTSNWFIRSDYDIRGFNFGVLNDLLMPGEISEATFFDHNQEERKLRNPDFLKLEALAIFQAILAYFEVDPLEVAPITGIIRDADTQKPMNNVSVQILNSNYNYSTDNYGNGIYAFHDLPEGQYIFEVTATGYQPRVDSIGIKSHEFNFLDFYLLPNILPLIENSSPSQGDSLFSPYEWIEIRFTRQMDSQSVASAILVQPDFPMELRWFDQNSKLRIIPQVILSFNEVYTIQIDTTAMDYEVNPIDGQGDGSQVRPYVLNFKTAPIDLSKPQILSTSPINLEDEIVVTDLVHIGLNKPLDQSTLTKENVVLLDQNQNRIDATFHQAAINGNYSLSIIPDNPFNEAERYTVTLRKSLSDSDGVGMDQHYQFLFKTDETIRDYALIDDFNLGLDQWFNPTSSERSFGFVEDQTIVFSSTNKAFRDSIGVMQIDYEITDNGILDFTFQGQKTVLYPEDIVGMYVFGNGSNDLIRFYFNDPSDGLESGDWQAIDWVGWKLVSFQVDKDQLFDYENGNGIVEDYLEFAGFQISGNGQGTLFIENVHLLHIPRITAVEESVDDEEKIIPETQMLVQGYPNPFSRSANHSGISINYEIPSYLDNAKINLSIYNTLGQQILELVNDIKMPGSYEIFWNVLDETGQILPAGIYFYRLQVNEMATTQRLVILN